MEAFFLTLRGGTSRFGIEGRQKKSLVRWGGGEWVDEDADIGVCRRVKSRCVFLIERVWPRERR